MSLLIDIARCPCALDSKDNVNHPCNRIVNSQTEGKYQLPEPWNGDICNSKILFIASNPSISSTERFPNNDWEDDEIEHFFSHRFENDYYKNVRFYKMIKKYASWILDCDRDNKDIEKKICITEVVHCKSKGQIGVEKACKHCVSKWLKNVIEEFNGEYIVILGAVARKFENEVRQFNKSANIIIMPHPNARGITDESRKKGIEEYRLAFSNVSSD